SRPGQRMDLRLPVSLLRPARSVLIVAVFTIALHPASGLSQNSPFNKQRVSFKSGDLTLVGYLFRPDGSGPFPTVVWNHGSERDAGEGPQFNAVASIFAPAGYAVCAPMRRGHSDSEGEYIVDAMDREGARRGVPAAQQLATRLLQTSQLDDQLAGLA